MRALLKSFFLTENSLNCLFVLIIWNWNCKDVTVFKRIFSKSYFVSMVKYYLIAMLFWGWHPCPSIYEFILFLCFIVLWAMGCLQLKLNYVFLCTNILGWTKICGGGGVISQCIFFSIWLNLSEKNVNHFKRNTSDHSIMQTIHSQD